MALWRGDTAVKLYLIIFILIDGVKLNKMEYRYKF